MSAKIDKTHLSEAEKRERTLSIVYKILPVVSVCMLIGLWILVSRNYDMTVFANTAFPSPAAVWARTVRLFTNPVKKKNLVDFLVNFFKKFLIIFKNFSSEASTVFDNNR